MKSDFLIYSESITERLRYIFNFIFEDILGLSLEISDDIDYFNKSILPKFAYIQTLQIKESLFLKASSLLYEKEITNISPDFFLFNKQPALFKSTSNSILPFDIFAASFYLISRYEEYLPFNPDKFGRYNATDSFAFKNGFLDQPVIDQWALLLKDNLLEHFPSLKFKKRTFKCIATIDIDNAYAHLHKGIIRTGFSIIQTLLINPKGLIEKVKVLLKLKKDPYDNYEYLDEIHESKGVSDIKYFILFSRYGRYDKNLSIKSHSFHKLIKGIANKHKICLHPSVNSNNGINILKNEKERLENVVGRKIYNSRQHFLKFVLPQTYENLIKVGIKYDYSMAYASHPGFRAGTCTPFTFFNLAVNTQTNLKIIPFAVMDTCFKNYLKCSPKESLKRIKKIITSIKKVDGLFVSLWHNETLDTNNQQFTWRHTYEGMLDATNNNN